MRSRFSKKVREEAALICAIAASTPGLTCNYDDVRSALGLPRHRSFRSYGEGPRWGSTLDSAAWRVANERRDLSAAECDAEAEALIRTGWSPP